MEKSFMGSQKNRRLVGRIWLPIIIGGTGDLVCFSVSSGCFPTSCSNMRLM